MVALPYICIFAQLYECMYLKMYDNPGPGGPRQPSSTPQTPFGNPFYGASSGLIRGGLGAYGEKILGSSSEYVQSN
ncbi:YIF1B-like protein, partial [Tanacetum coccineum]